MTLLPDASAQCATMLHLMNAPYSLEGVSHLPIQAPASRRRAAFQRGCAYITATPQGTFSPTHAACDLVGGDFDKPQCGPNSGWGKGRYLKLRDRSLKHGGWKRERYLKYRVCRERHHHAMGGGLMVPFLKARSPLLTLSTHNTQAAHEKGPATRGVSNSKRGGQRLRSGGKQVPSGHMSKARQADKDCSGHPEALSAHVWIETLSGHSFQNLFLHCSASSCALPQCAPVHVRLLPLEVLQVLDPLQQQAQPQRFRMHITPRASKAQIGPSPTSAAATSKGSCMQERTRKPSSNAPRHTCTMTTPVEHAGTQSTVLALALKPVVKTGKVGLTSKKETVTPPPLA